MKFTCLQENLVKGLAVVGKAVATKGSLPVLSNVLLTSDKGRLKLSTTNLELAITTWIGASVEEEGSVTVPSRVLYEFVANLVPSTLQGFSDGTSLKIVSDRVSSKFNGIDSAEFPSLPDVPSEVHLKIDPKIFSEAVSETAFASAVDESRPVLTGVLLKVEGGLLYMVGVDGFRLAERIIELEGGLASAADFSAIVPSKTLLEVARLVSSFKEPLEFSLNKEGNLAVFKLSDLLISTRLLDGSFPEYKKLIPDKAETSIRVELQAKDFVNALRLANVFAKEALSAVKIKVDSLEGSIHIFSSNSEMGENSSKVEAKITGGDIEVAFNSKYILDALGNVKSEVFVFECSDSIGPGKPGILRPYNREDHTYLLMPLQF